MSKRRQFSAEFKRGAVEQASQPGVSCAQVARELGIRDTLLTRWRREAQRQGKVTLGNTGRPGAIQLASSANGPKLLLATSKVMADVMRTAAAVSAVVWDERRVQDFYKAMMEEIAAESPAVAARIAARLEDLNARAGLASGMGR